MIAEQDSREKLIETAKLWYLTFIQSERRPLSEAEMDVLWASVQRAGGVPEAEIIPPEQRCLTVKQMGAIHIYLSDDGRTIVFDRHIHPGVSSTYRAKLPAPMPLTPDALLRIDEFASVLPHLSWRPVVNT
ncbi:hypothetical protein [Mesorhizobium sp. CN2-181]|uniref:hypothetical protein n=1 Tax=Mesorhizobium yinganensis TaxID=3157707 RepID=UPI0032B7B56B